MDIKTIESIEKDDPSEETLRLTTRWKEITKPGEKHQKQIHAGTMEKIQPIQSTAGRTETNRS